MNFKMLFLSIIFVQIFYLKQIFSIEHNNGVQIQVFYDQNKNGYKDMDDFGVGAIEVKFNNKDCITDYKGNCYFNFDENSSKNILNKIKIYKTDNLKFTTENSFNFINDGTPAQVEVGVYFEYENIDLLTPETLRVNLSSGFYYDHVIISGNVKDKVIEINNKAVDTPLATCEYDGPEVISEIKKGFIFRIDNRYSKKIKNWFFQVINEKYQTIFQDEGNDKLPKTIFWDGLDKNKNTLTKNIVYFYNLKIQYEDYFEVTTPFKSLNFSLTELYDDVITDTNKVIIEEKAKVVQSFFKRSVTSRLILVGNRTATEKIKNLLISGYMIDPRKIIIEQKISENKEMVELKIVSTAIYEAINNQEGILAKGVFYKAALNGSFKILLKDVAVNEYLNISLKAADGSVLLLNVRPRQSEFLSRFSIKSLEKDFVRSQSNKAGFQFSYIINGTYPAEYKLYDFKGTLLNNENTLLEIEPQIGLNAKAYVLVDASDSRQDLIYKVNAKVAEANSKRAFLKVLLPKQIITDRFVHIKGYTTRDGRLFIDGTEALIAQDGSFGAVKELKKYKNNINFLKKGDKNQNYNVNYSIANTNDNVTFLRKLNLYLGLRFYSNRWTQSDGLETLINTKSFMPTFEFFTTFYPLNSIYKTESSSDTLGFNFGYERGFYSETVPSKISGKDSSIKGPEWFKFNIIYDTSTYFKQLTPIFRLGYYGYIFKIFGEGAYRYVNFGYKPFSGLALDYKSFWFNTRILAEIGFDYGLPIDNKNAYEVWGKVGIDVFSNQEIELGFKRRNYYVKNSSSSDWINETYNGIFVGTKVSF